MVEAITGEPCRPSPADRAARAIPPVLIADLRGVRMSSWGGARATMIRWRVVEKRPGPGIAASASGSVGRSAIRFAAKIAMSPYGRNPLGRTQIGCAPQWATARFPRDCAPFSRVSTALGPPVRCGSKRGASPAAKPSRCRSRDGHGRERPSAGLLSGNVVRKDPFAQGIYRRAGRYPHDERRAKTAIPRHPLRNFRRISVADVTAGNDRPGIPAIMAARALLPVTESERAIP